MAQLLSLNVGLPQDVRWHDKTVHTAVWKHSVAGKGRVRHLNIDGDKQGDLIGHGGGGGRLALTCLAVSWPRLNEHCASKYSRAEMGTHRCRAVIHSP